MNPSLASRDQSCIPSTISTNQNHAEGGPGSVFSLGLGSLRRCFVIVVNSRAVLNEPQHPANPNFTTWQSCRPRPLPLMPHTSQSRAASKVLIARLCIPALWSLPGKQRIYRHNLSGSRPNNTCRQCSSAVCTFSWHPQSRFYRICRGVAPMTSKTPNPLRHAPSARCPENYTHR